MRNLYALVKAYRPELLMNMSCRDLASIFGETAAAVSWRVNAIVTKPLAARGFTSSHLRFQKTASARAKLSKAQMGNRNRSKGAAKRAA
jgi:hypothetical protein